jgi:hypothetical protein
MLLLACLILAPSLLVAEIKSAGWRPIAPQRESEGHLAVSYHALPLQHYHQLGEALAAEDSRGHDQCVLYKVSFVQDLYFQVKYPSKFLGRVL